MSHPNEDEALSAAVSALQGRLFDPEPTEQVAARNLLEKVQSRLQKVVQTSPIGRDAEDRGLAFRILEEGTTRRSVNGTPGHLEVLYQRGGNGGIWSLGWRWKASDGESPTLDRVLPMTFDAEENEFVGPGEMLASVFLVQAITDKIHRERHR